jgi:RNA-directed DNA polymerase
MGSRLKSPRPILASNLYRLWNRLSSGSYFPPPVKLEESPSEWRHAAVPEDDVG